MENSIRLISIERIIELSGGAFTKNAIREWDDEPAAPKPVKLGRAANSKRAYVEGEVLAYFTWLADRRAVANAEASESARRAGRVSAEARAKKRAAQQAATEEVSPA